MGNRLRYNGLVAALGGSGLTTTATSVTFAAGLTHSGGTNVPTIAGTDYIPLTILDANGAVSEIVYLTAYTAAATTGTISRGREATGVAGTSGPSHSAGDKVAQSATMVDLLMENPGDAPPATPNAKDDEGDGTTLVTWLNTPTTINAYDVNATVPRQSYFKASGSGSTLVGKYVAPPGSPTYPYTVTIKVAASTARKNYQRGLGLILMPASPTSSTGVVWFGTVHNSANGGLYPARITYSNMSTFSAENARSATDGTALLGDRYRYLRVTMSSATAAVFKLSVDGTLWQDFESYTIPFSVAFIGRGLSEEATNAIEGASPFLRVT